MNSGFPSGLTFALLFLRSVMFNGLETIKCLFLKERKFNDLIRFKDTTFALASCAASLSITVNNSAHLLLQTENYVPTCLCQTNNAVVKNPSIKSIGIHLSIE